MSESQEKPGRYQRTTGGLIGSMIVAVVVVLGVVVFRETFRDTPEFEPESVDYLPAVAALQGEGRQVAYPPELPDGWMVTGIDVEPGQRPSWSMALLTDDDKYVGIHQRDEDIDRLVEEHIDENATEGEPVRLDSPIASEWTTYSDDGGDHGFATTITTDAGEESLLVYGSAPTEDLEALIGLLTLDPVPASG